jgi:FlaA1/EpsC-like NDP-sugar epimerase
MLTHTPTASLRAMASSIPTYIANNTLIERKPAMKMYSKFLLMTATSTVIMFILMYLNTYELDHIFFSETRAYMALLMGATMAIVMLLFMLKMYPDRTLNTIILVASAIIFSVSLWLVRSQTTIEDVSWMRAMIPHHSIAILTSERAGIKDPRVRKLADGIIEAQRREIGEMKVLIKDLETKH